MKKYIILALLALFHSAIACQTIVVEKSTNLTIGKSVIVSLVNNSLFIYGDLSCDTFSIINLDNSELISDTKQTLYTLNIINDSKIETLDTFLIHGDVLLTNGCLNIDYGVLKFSPNSSILNETQDNYIYSKTHEGIIIKDCQGLSSSSNYNSGIGLSFTPTTNSDVALVRSHEIYYHDNSESFKRVYYFPEPIDLETLDYQFNSYETIKEPLLFIESYDNQGVWQQITDNSSLLKNISRAAIFPFPELNYSKIITPNGDGYNDYFKVYALEKYPNNRLVIFDRTGKILLDQENYNNDFDGALTTLSTGTYFFSFFTDKNNKTPTKKGFFEVINN